MIEEQQQQEEGNDDQLGAGLSESYRAHQREVAIKHLSQRLHLTLGQLAKVVGDKDHGEVVATIRLEDILRRAAEDPETSEDEEEEPAQPKSAKKGPKKASKKEPKKAPKKGGKASPKAKATKKAPKDGRTRLDYEQSKREVLAALKAGKDKGEDSLGRTAIEEATGLNDVQVRAVMAKLIEEGKAKAVGKGRGATYALA